MGSIMLAQELPKVIIIFLSVVDTCTHSRLLSSSLEAQPQVSVRSLLFTAVTAWRSCKKMMLAAQHQGKGPSTE